MFRKIGKNFFVYTALFYTLMDKTISDQDHNLIGLIIKFVNHFDPTEIYVLRDNLESKSRNASFCQTLSKGLQGAGYLKILVVTNATRSIGVNGRDLSRNVVVISLSKAESIFRVLQQVSPFEILRLGVRTWQLFSSSTAKSAYAKSQLSG